MNMKKMDGVLWVRVDTVKKLADKKGFRHTFESNIKECQTFNEAYERTESMHEEVFGFRKYSCYQSFATNNKVMKR